MYSMTSGDIDKLRIDAERKCADLRASLAKSEQDLREMCCAVDSWSDFAAARAPSVMQLDAVRERQQKALKIIATLDGKEGQDG